MGTKPTRNGKPGGTGFCNSKLEKSLVVRQDGGSKERKEEEKNPATSAASQTNTPGKTRRKGGFSASRKRRKKTNSTVRTLGRDDRRKLTSTGNLEVGLRPKDDVADNNLFKNCLKKFPFHNEQRNGTNTVSCSMGSRGGKP